MPVKSFSFSSPGVKINEIDKSQIQKEAAPVGPIIVGRAQRGPAMRPVTVASYDEFVQTFGDPVAGGDSSGDVWRSGIPAGPTYGPYAAQAWLANSPTLTYVRLLGTQADSATSTTDLNAGYTGWRVGGDTSGAKTGSFGMFLFPSSSTGVALTGTLAAVWYCNGTVPVHLPAPAPRPFPVYRRLHPVTGAGRRAGTGRRAAVPGAPERRRSSYGAHGARRSRGRRVAGPRARPEATGQPSPQHARVEATSHQRLRGLEPPRAPARSA